MKNWFSWAQRKDAICSLLQVKQLFVVVYHIKPIYSIGLMAVPGAAGGSVVGSIIVKKLKMDCRSCIRGMFIMSCLLVMLSFAFFLECDNAQFYGVNVSNTSLWVKYCFYLFRFGAKIHIPTKLNCQTKKSSYLVVSVMFEGSDNLCLVIPVHRLSHWQL